MLADDYTVIPLCRFHHDCWHDARAPFNLPKEERRAWADARIAETQRHVLGATLMPETGTGAVQGDRHPSWKGDTATPTTKRERAQRRYPLGPCERCLKPGTDRHHKDGDTGNNLPSNVEILCRRCHMIVDGRLSKFKATGDQARRRHRKPPRACRICARVVAASRMWRERCHRCHEYWRRHGEDRPWGNTNAPRGGEDNGRAKLTVEQVLEIRASKESLRTLAVRYGVGKTAIADVRNGRKWKDVA